MLEEVGRLINREKVGAGRSFWVLEKEVRREGKGVRRADFIHPCLRC